MRFYKSSPFMRTHILIGTIVFLSTGFACAQANEITARYYFTTRDYLDGKLSDSEVILVTREMGDDYMYVQDVLEKETRKRSKNGIKAWAIEYNGDAYFHLMYSEKTGIPRYYVMLDIKGTYCLAVMGQAFLPSLKKASPNLGVTGLVGTVAVAESWGADFADSTGALHKVLVVDTRDVLPITQNSPGEFLNRAKLKWFLGLKQLEGRLDEYSVEDILARADVLNGRN
jgi:hypothetical protein